MSGKKKTDMNINQETDGKIITKYDRKMQKKRELERKAALEKKIIKIVLVVAAAVITIVIGIKSITDYNRIHNDYIKIGDESVSQIEFDYYYNNAKNGLLSQQIYSGVTYGQYMASYMGYDKTKDDANQTYSGDNTWFDYFANMAVSALKEDKALLKVAEERNFEYADADKDYEDFVSNLKKAADDNQKSLKKYIKETYGSHATEKSIEPFVREALKANAMKDSLNLELAATNEDVDKYYQDNKKLYDTVSYRILDVNDGTNGTDAKTRAEEMLSKITTEQDFVDLCPMYADDSDSYKSDDNKSLVSSGAYSASKQALSDWLFDDGRTAGDKDVIEDTENDTYSVVYFLERKNGESDNQSLIENTILSNNYSDFIKPYEESLKLTDKHNRIKLYEE